ncbi:MAG: peptidoglycan DD-metalloendopeptidase family protein [Methylobacillus sp.]|jgi:septal ring factor EnvC (AmiA/AmiB activator)|nr:peptidoglycan DD-metalloendopeptidase family protein [Methylobacillus sp.]
MNRRSLLIILTLFLLAPTFAHADRKAEAAREDLQDLKSRIKALEKELDNTKEAHSDAADALKESERAISESDRKLHEIGKQQTENRQTLQAQQKKLSALNTTLAAQRKMLGAQFHRQYVHGQRGYLQILLSGEDPNALARDLHYFSYLAHARADNIAALRENQREVAELNKKTAATLAEIDTLKGDQEKQRKQLESEKRDRKQVLQKLAGKIQTERGEINKLRRDEKRLTDLVERLARIVPSKPKKKTAPDTTDTTSRAPTTPVGKNDALPNRSVAGTAFAALKGKLNLPVRGDITNKFGAAREESGVLWKGLFIRAGEGTQVKAIASGTVVFADWLRGFGNLLIIDHGDGFMSLYGNNQSLLKNVGDEVSPGDNIASVGSSGGNAEPGLYFEMRHQSKPFDPLAWCVLR